MKNRSASKPISYMGSIERFCEKWADRVLFVFMGAYVVLFSILCFLKYHSFGYLDWDFASDVTILWNSIHGRLLYYPFFEQNILGAHLFLIYFLIIPIYFIFQHPLTLLFLQSLILGLGAYPLYLLAKSELNKTFALAIALGYLLYPSLGFMNLFETHFDSYVIFFLFFAIYYFQKENFFNFLIFLFLAIICKESSSMVVFMFGIYAFLRKKSKRWIFTPLILGAGWFLIALKLVIPYFARGDAKNYQEGFIFSVYYSHLGKNMSEMFKTIFTHPFLVARFALVLRKIHYLFDLFSPTAFFGFFSPAVLLMTVPIFMQNLLSLASTHASIYYQYVAMLIPFIFASVIFSFKKFFRNRTAFSKRNVLLGIFLFFSIVSAYRLNAPQVRFLRVISTYRYTDVERAKDLLVREIPRSAPTITTFQFLPRLGSRHEIYSMHLVATGLKMNTNIKYEPPLNLEYALIDFNEPLLIGSFFPPQAPDNIRAFLERGNWQVLNAVGDIVLLKKDYPKGHKLCEIVQNPKIQNIINANINNRMLFLGYDVVDDKEDKGKILHLVFYWKRTADFDTSVGLFVQFLDSSGETKFTNVHSFGYRIYMPQNMPKDQVMREERYILIPSGAGNKVYSMRAGLFSLENGAILPVAEREKTDALGRLLLGDVSIP